MAVGVVAAQLAVVYPYDALCAQQLLEALLDAALCHRLVTVRRQQAGGGGEHGASPVALDGSAFEHEVQAVAVFAIDDAAFEELAVDGVVLGGGELFSPSVEAEVEQAVMAVVVGQCDEAVVAGPGVVGVER